VSASHRPARVHRLTRGRAAAAATGAAALTLVAAGCGGGQSGTGAGQDSTTTNGPCTVHVYPGLPPRHLTDLNAKPRYNSFPPTSGPHYQSPAKYNIYPYAIPQVALVHNLEHGGVVIQYGNGVPKATVAKLRAWYLEHTNGLLVAPLPKLDDKIALGAWNAPPYKQGREPQQQDAGHGYLALCSDFDESAFTNFVRAHEYKAGERFPKTLLARKP
jgi:hypothetical protein